VRQIEFLNEAVMSVLGSIGSFKITLFWYVTFLVMGVVTLQTTRCMYGTSSVSFQLLL